MSNLDDSRNDLDHACDKKVTEMVQITSAGNCKQKLSKENIRNCSENENATTDCSEPIASSNSESNEKIKKQKRVNIDDDTVSTKKLKVMDESQRIAQHYNLHKQIDPRERHKSEIINLRVCYFIQY